MSDIHFSKQTGFYRGKVRDVYFIDNNYLVMIASDRISAFDVILPKKIPFKGQVLNQIAAFMLNATKDICKNWLIATPTPNSSIGLKCEPFKIELVVRGHLTGHAWRTYQSGKRFLCGVVLPEEMIENQPFLHPIITPSTKAAEGHDEDISKEDIIAKGLATENEWQQLEKIALALFKRGQEVALEHGLILADTKYEFGKIGDEIILMDEIHTPDSSRYFYADGFDERLQRNEKQKQLSKEFVREWLIENNFMGKEGQTIPEMTDEWVNTISQRYIELFEKITGEEFVPQTVTDAELLENINNAIYSL